MLAYGPRKNLHVMGPGPSKTFHIMGLWPHYIGLNISNQWAYRPIR